VFRQTFLDVTNTNVSKVQNCWKMATHRRVLHFVTDHLLSIQKCAEDSRRNKFSPEHFMDTLCREMSTCRRQPGDESNSIIWKTQKDRMINWSRLQPQIVSLVANPLVSRGLNSSSSQSIFPDDKNKRLKGSKDIFFRTVKVSSSGVQLNQIITSRVLYYMQGKGVLKGNNPFSSRTFRVQIVDDLWYDHFFQKRTQYADVAKSVLEQMRGEVDNVKPDLRSAATINKGLWLSCGDGSWDLFVYEGVVESQMNTHLASEDKSEAIQYAHLGYITKNFLKYLFLLRMHYHNHRLMGTHDIAIKLNEYIRTGRQ
jgi:hypothetical protein